MMASLAKKFSRDSLDREKNIYIVFYILTGFFKLLTLNLTYLVLTCKFYEVNVHDVRCVAVMKSSSRYVHVCKLQTLWRTHYSCLQL